MVLFIFSCNKQPCECDYINMQFIEFKLVNQQGQNLIFGSYSKFIADSIQVLKEPNSFNFSNATVSKGFIDSTGLHFDFHIPAIKSYIYYNRQTQQDSLEIKWITKTGKCCGSSSQYSVVDSVKFNNVLAMPVNGVYTFIK